MHLKISRASEPLLAVRGLGLIATGSWVVCKERERERERESERERGRERERKKMREIERQESRDTAKERGAHQVRVTSSNSNIK